MLKNFRSSLVREFLNISKHIDQENNRNVIKEVTITKSGTVMLVMPIIRIKNSPNRFQNIIEVGFIKMSS